MKSSTILSLVGVSVCMLIIGAAIGSVILRPSTSVSTKTVTATSQNTVVEIVTRVSTLSAPAKITVNGTVDSEYYYPYYVIACYRGKSIDVVNSTETVTGIGIACGTYTAYVQNITHMVETSDGSNQTYNYYQGSFSIVLPNNASYLFQVNLRNLSYGTSFDQDVGLLPLNYTISAQISDYNIFCYFSNGSLNAPFQCGPSF